jgi:hypothetical protein
MVCGFYAVSYTSVKAHSKKILDNQSAFCYYTFAHGGIAQLGERLNGIQEVSGSIPLISTKGRSRMKVLGLFYFIRFRRETLTSCILARSEEATEAGHGSDRSPQRFNPAYLHQKVLKKHRNSLCFLNKTETISSTDYRCI